MKEEKKNACEMKSVDVKKCERKKNTLIVR